MRPRLAPAAKGHAEPGRRQQRDQRQEYFAGEAFRTFGHARHLDLVFDLGGVRRLLSIGCVGMMTSTQGGVRHLLAISARVCRSFAFCPSACIQVREPNVISGVILDWSFRPGMACEDVEMFVRKTLPSPFSRAVVLATAAALVSTLAVPPVAQAYPLASSAAKTSSAEPANASEATDLSSRAGRRVVRPRLSQQRRGAAFMGLALGTVGAIVAEQRRRDYYRDNYYYGGGPYYGNRYYGGPAYYGGGYPYAGGGYYTVPRY